jgi:hypothetical protein
VSYFNTIFFRGHTLPVSIDRYGTMENLYRELTVVLGCPSLPSGVRQIFGINGEKVIDLGNICNGGNFVVAGSELFKPYNYNAIENTNGNLNSPATKLRAKQLFKSESFKELRTNESTPLKQNQFIRARNIIVLEHGNRPRKVVSLGIRLFFFEILFSSIYFQTMFFESKTQFYFYKFKTEYI